MMSSDEYFDDDNSTSLLKIAVANDANENKNKIILISGGNY